MNIPAAYGRISPIAAHALFYCMTIEAVHFQTSWTAILFVPFLLALVTGTFWVYCVYVCVSMINDMNLNSLPFLDCGAF
jgi:hypothetical protein